MLGLQLILADRGRGKGSVERDREYVEKVEWVCVRCVSNYGSIGKPLVK